MTKLEKFRQLALNFEEATEEPHFHKNSFRVRKKIFATLDLEKSRAVVKLSEIEQSVFCSFDSSVIYPVSGAWGKQGWTIVELETVREDMLLDVLTVSYCNVAPKTLSIKYKKE